MPQQLFSINVNFLLFTRLVNSSRSTSPVMQGRCTMMSFLPSVWFAQLPYGTASLGETVRPPLVCCSRSVRNNQTSVMSVMTLFPLSLSGGVNLPVERMAQSRQESLPRLGCWKINCGSLLIKAHIYEQPCRPLLNKLDHHVVNFKLFQQWWRFFNVRALCGRGNGLWSAGGLCLY